MSKWQLPVEGPSAGRADRGGGKSAGAGTDGRLPAGDEAITSSAGSGTTRLGCGGSRVELKAACGVPAADADHPAGDEHPAAEPPAGSASVATCEVVNTVSAFRVNTVEAVQGERVGQQQQQ